MINQTQDLLQRELSQQQVQVIFPYNGLYYTGTITANGTITSTGGFIGNADTPANGLHHALYIQDDPAGNLTDVNGQFTIDGSGDVTEVVLTFRKEKIEDYVVI